MWQLIHCYGVYICLANSVWGEDYCREGMLLSEVLTCVPVGDERELQGVSRKRKAISASVSCCFFPKVPCWAFFPGCVQHWGCFRRHSPSKSCVGLTPATGLRWGMGRGSAVGKLGTKSPVPFKKLNFILILVFPKGTDIKVSLKIQ